MVTVNVTVNAFIQKTSNVNFTVNSKVSLTVMITNTIYINFLLKVDVDINSFNPQCQLRRYRQRKLMIFYSYLQKK